MPSDFWKTIEASRFFDGALWTSNLSIDHIARHLALFGVTGQAIIQNASLAAPGQIDRDCRAIFPDSWDNDDTFALTKLVLQVPVRVTTTAGTAFGTIEIVGGSNSATLFGGAFEYLTRDYQSPFPTGPQLIRIRMVATEVNGSSVAFDLDVADGVGVSWQVVPR